MTSNTDYPLGSSDAEHPRLMFQARVLRQWTDRFPRQRARHLPRTRPASPVTSVMAFTRFELTGGQRSALDEVSARVPST